MTLTVVTTVRVIVTGRTWEWMFLPKAVKEMTKPPATLDSRTKNTLQQAGSSHCLAAGAWLTRRY